MNTSRMGGWVVFFVTVALSMSAGKVIAGMSITFQLTGSMNTARYFHTATLLPDGKVLVAGGFNEANVGSAELYDPETRAWTYTGSLATARRAHTATLLPNGLVLVAGGVDASETPTATAETLTRDRHVEFDGQPQPKPLIGHGHTALQWNGAGRRRRWDRRSHCVCGTL